MRLVHEETLQPQKFEKMLRDERKLLGTTQVTDKIGIEKSPGHTIFDTRVIKWDAGMAVGNDTERASIRIVQKDQELTVDGAGCVRDIRRGQQQFARPFRIDDIAENGAADHDRGSSSRLHADRTRMEILRCERALNEFLTVRQRKAAAVPP